VKILLIGSNSFIGKYLKQFLKKRYELTVISKLSNYPFFFNLNFPHNIKINLKKYDLIIYLPFLKQSNKATFYKQYYSLLKILNLKNKNTNFIFFSTFNATIKYKYSYSYTKSKLEKLVLSYGGNVLKVAFVYDNNNKHSLNKFISVINILRIIPCFIPDYKINVININSLIKKVNKIINQNINRREILLTDEKINFYLFLRKLYFFNYSRKIFMLPVPRVLSNFFLSFILKKISKNMFLRFKNLEETDV